MNTTPENEKNSRIEPSDGSTKRKILIVDDEVAFTSVVKLTLEMKKNYDVCVEIDPRFAITTALRFEPDIIIMDVIMPEMNGGELYTLFKANRSLRNIPIIFLTAFVRRQDVVENNGLIGERSNIAKPIDADELIKAMEERVRSSVMQRCAHSGT